MLDSQDLIDGYLDETLTPDESAAFVQWLHESPQNRQRFAEAVWLHDRLRGEFLAVAALTSKTDPSVASRRFTETPRASKTRWWVRTAVAMLALSGVVVVMAVLWKELGESPAAAAVVELNRLIAASARASDRTYQIVVEEVAIPAKPDERRTTPESGRPPKPPLDGAVLHVRAGQQFVLIRTTTDGLPFFTGSDGRTSWAVRPDGPVRVSTDLTRFHRDLPGHESAIPLINIEDGLAELRERYEVRLMPVESDEGDVQPADASRRSLVATKKRGIPGPRRVEIIYAVTTGQIRQMRFIEMPYGPERLTVRLTLVEERDLGERFFEHVSHHAPERIVEEE